MAARSRMLAVVCAGCAAGLVAAEGVAASRLQSRPAPVLRPAGVGAVRFGVAKSKAVAELSRVFGAPSARGANTGCSPRYTEVVWGDLAVEFRSGVFSGYRYLVHGYPITTSGSPRGHVPRTVSPRLTTANGVTLGSTLAQVRAAYGSLRRVAADGWRSQDGLIFVDDAMRDPVPPTSRIIEIKIGACGDF